ncbi:EpsG family protein [Tranquillimonas rosea]|uniref:EpsG family protein n=1 Tax=Tranquillimonas rosea TaxID=641238 RepID=UPI003BA8B743
MLYGVVAFALFLFSAFRFEVGCDWSGYFFQYMSAAGSQDFSILAQREPLWWWILHYLSDQEIPYPVVNVVSSAIFFVGVHCLARRQPDPLSFLILLFPILIVNMPMSGIRQGAAIGLFCIALTSFLDGNRLKFGLWIVIASGFHSSASVFLLLLPLVSGKYSRTRLITALLLAIPGAIIIASGSSASLAIERYVDSGLDAAGSAFRVGALFLSGGFFFLFLKSSWSKKFPDDFALAHLFSLGMVALIILVPVSTVIGDRIGYFFIPVQAIIFSRIPFLNVPSKGALSLLPYLGLAAMFTTWVLISDHFNECYVPYNNWLLGFPNDFWLGV